MGQQQQKQDREATEARAEVASESGGQEKVYDRRHALEIERAENVAAGLPPEGLPQKIEADEKEPIAKTAPVEPEKPFEPVPVSALSHGIVEKFRSVADRVIKKVQRLVRKKEESHKEIIINAESLETRVAVMEENRLEEFTIERTSEDRLVGSIFKGKVRNLEDGLKAAFVDIGFEKNAFLHYWDIVPNQFDSGVEIVERETRRRDRPRITQRDIPRHPARLPAGQRHHRAGHERPDRHERPARHDEHCFARKIFGAAAELGSERHLAQD